MADSDEIIRYRGDTKPIVFKLWLDKAAGVPLPLTDFVITLTIDPSKTPVDGTKNILSLVGEITATPGVVRFLPTDEQMDITPGKYFYDLQVIDTEGFISTEILDSFKVLQDITKTTA